MGSRSGGVKADRTAPTSEERIGQRPTLALRAQRLHRAWTLGQDGLTYVSPVILYARMETVTIRDLRNHGGDVVERVEAGERVTVTRDGRPVAELRPVRSRGVLSAVLLERWRRLPAVDVDALRRDIDAIIDQSL